MNEACPKLEGWEDKEFQVSFVTAAHGEGPKFRHRVSPQPSTLDGFEKAVGVCRGGSGTAPNPAETKNRGASLWGPPLGNRNPGVLAPVNARSPS